MSDVPKFYSSWSRGFSEKFETEGHAPHDACTRLTNDDFVDIAFSPKFKLKKTAKFFAIGSCFARNIEASLRSNGAEVLSMDINLPNSVKESLHHFENEILTKFNPHSMQKELGATFSDLPLDHGFIELGPNKIWNPQLHRVDNHDLETQIKTSRAVRDTVKKVADADVIFITLGLTETWWDKWTSTPLNDSVRDWKYAKRTDRFEFKNTTYSESYECMLETFEIIKNNTNVDPKIVLTVSPVPLLRTFSGQDVIVANSYSKSVLRAVAQGLTDSIDYVDYFPSYEMVINTPRHIAWRHDQRHVQHEMVWSIMRRFREAYIV